MSPASRSARPVNCAPYHFCDVWLSEDDLRSRAAGADLHVATDESVIGGQITAGPQVPTSCSTLGRCNSGPAAQHELIKGLARNQEASRSHLDEGPQGVANTVDGQLREGGSGWARSQGGHASPKFVIHLVRDAVMVEACAEGHRHHLQPHGHLPENRDRLIGCGPSAPPVDPY